VLDDRDNITCVTAAPARYHELTAGFEQTGAAHDDLSLVFDPMKDSVGEDEIKLAIGRQLPGIHLFKLQVRIARKRVMASRVVDKCGTAIDTEDKPIGYRGRELAVIFPSPQPMSRIDSRPLKDSFAINSLAHESCASNVWRNLLDSIPWRSSIVEIEKKMG